MNGHLGIPRSRQPNGHKPPAVEVAFYSSAYPLAPCEIFPDRFIPPKGRRIACIVFHGFGAGGAECAGIRGNVESKVGSSCSQTRAEGLESAQAKSSLNCFVAEFMTYNMLRRNNLQSNKGCKNGYSIV